MFQMEYINFEKILNLFIPNVARTIYFLNSNFANNN